MGLSLTGVSPTVERPSGKNPFQMAIKPEPVTSRVCALVHQETLSTLKKTKRYQWILSRCGRNDTHLYFSLCAITGSVCGKSLGKFFGPILAGQSQNRYFTLLIRQCESLFGGGTLPATPANTCWIGGCPPTPMSCIARIGREIQWVWKTTTEQIQIWWQSHRSLQNSYQKVPYAPPSFDILGLFSDDQNVKDKPGIGRNLSLKACLILGEISRCAIFAGWLSPHPQGTNTD